MLVFSGQYGMSEHGMMLHMYKKMTCKQWTCELVSSGEELVSFQHRYNEHLEIMKLNHFISRYNVFLYDRLMPSFQWLQNNHLITKCSAYLNVKLSAKRHLGLYSLRRCRLTGIGIPMINLRRSDDRLRFIMGIPILIRRHLLSE